MHNLSNYACYASTVELTIPVTPAKDLALQLCHTSKYQLYSWQVCRGTAVMMVSPTSGTEEIANPFGQDD